MANLTGTISVPHSDTSIIDTTQQVPLGTRARDASGNEYIYLKGVASTAAGDFVTYDSAFATARLAVGGYGPVAVAGAAIVADRYGWYQIAGVSASTANVATDAAGAGKFIYASATAGRATTTAATTDGIIGALPLANPAANTAVVHLNYPTIMVNALTP